MGKLPSVLDITPDDFRRLQALKAVRDRLASEHQLQLEIWYYDPHVDGMMIGESPANPAFILAEAIWTWWGGTVPVPARRTICVAELSDGAIVENELVRMVDERWSHIAAATPAA